MNQRLKNVVKWIEGQGLANSQADIAFKMGNNKTYLSQLVIGKKKISQKFIEKLCEVFPEVNYDYLIKGIGDVNASENKMPASKNIIEKYDPGGEFNCDRCKDKDAIITLLREKVAALEIIIKSNEEKKPNHNGQKRKVV